MIKNGYEIIQWSLTSKMKTPHVRDVQNSRHGIPDAHKKVNTSPAAAPRVLILGVLDAKIEVKLDPANANLSICLFLCFVVSH